MKYSKKLKISMDSALKLAIIFAIVVGTAALAYRYVYYLPQKDKQRIEAEERKEKEELDRKKGEESADKVFLTFCLEQAEKSYKSNWNSECSALGLGNDCTLPTWNATRMDKWRSEAKDECYKRN